MNITERIKNVFEFKPVDRLPMLEWAPWWDKTIDRWYKEGLDEFLKSTGDPGADTFRDGSDEFLKSSGEITDRFGLDPFRVVWIHPKDPVTSPLPEQHGAGVITDEQSYREFKKYLYPKPGFDRKQLKILAEKRRAGEMAVWVWMEGYFWFPRVLLGIEQHLYSFYDNPELLHLINSDLLEYHKYIIEELCGICVPDIMVFAEDLSYNHGPMLSKECFETFISPYYRKLVPTLKSYGIHPIMDSDGDIATVIPWLKEAGLEGLGPLEYMAGVDVVKIRTEHPDFLMLGGFNKLVMSQGEQAMRREFERLLPVMASGGYILTVDHQTPPEVSLAQYRIYIQLLHEYCEKAALKIKAKDAAKTE